MDAFAERTDNRAMYLALRDRMYEFACPVTGILLEVDEDYGRNTWCTHRPRVFLWNWHHPSFDYNDKELARAFAELERVYLKQ